MTNFIEKKDRRFPLGVIPLAIYVVIVCISASIAAIAGVAFAMANQEAAVFIGAIIGAIIGAVIGSILGSLLYVAMIVMLSLKVHHWTQIFPGVVGAIISTGTLLVTTITWLVDLIRSIGNGISLPVILDNIVTATSIACTLIAVVGWVCYVLLVVFATKRDGKKSGLVKLFMIGACLLFLGGVISNSVGIVVEIIQFIIGAHVVVTSIVTIICSLLAIVADFVGGVAIIMICSWFINPAKRGYVPVEIAEEISAEAFAEATAPAAAEEVAEEVTAEAAE